MKKNFKVQILLISFLTMLFLSAANPVAAPAPQAPAGPTSDTTPTYKWSKLASATSYQYQLSQGIKFIYSQTVQASACGANICMHTPTKALTPSSYRWRVRAMVGGVWQPFSAYKVFTLYAPGVKIINKYTYSTTGNYRYVVGEVYNATTNYVRGIKISVNFLNNEQLVATDSAHTYVNTLAPNEKACFSIFMENPPSWTSYSFEGVSFYATSEPRPKITVLSHTGSVYNDDYKILGQLRNDDPKTITYTAAIATLYNAAGTPIACDFNYANTLKLTPGKTTSFEIIADLPNTDTVASYILTADAYYVK